MKPAARHAFGTPPVSGHRFEPRPSLAVPATLHVDGAVPLAVTVADLSPRGCRIAATVTLPVAAYVSLMLDGATLISGRIAWNDGAGIGVEFCTALLPRIVRRLTARAASDAAA